MTTSNAMIISCIISSLLLVIILLISKFPSSLQSSISLFSKDEIELDVKYFNYDYFFTEVPNGDSVQPTGIWASSTGQYSIASYSNGHIYRSERHGKEWKGVKIINDDSEPGTYAYFQGLVMTDDGSEMLASSNQNYIFKSEDYGETFTVKAKHS